MWITSGPFIEQIYGETFNPSNFFYIFENTDPNVTFLAWWFTLGLFIFGFIAYLIGSINTAQIMSKIKREDLSRIGSGNYGSTNAWRAWGPIGFVVVFILDVLKAIVCGMILWILAAGLATIPTELTKQESLLCSLYMVIPFALIFVAVGHAFPIFFKFKGGKCVATSFGLIILINWIMAIFAIAAFLAIIKFTKNMALASMMGTLLGGALVMFSPFFYSSNAYLLVAPWSLMWPIWPAAFCVVGIVEMKHIPNVLRMIDGKELLIKNEN